MDVLGDGVLKFIACRLTVDGEIPDDSPIEAFHHMSIMHASCGSCRIAKHCGMMHFWNWYVVLTRALMSSVKEQGVHGEAEGPEQLAFQVSAPTQICNQWTMIVELTRCFILYENWHRAVFLCSRIASSIVWVGSNGDPDDQTKTW